MIFQYQTENYEYKTPACISKPAFLFYYLLSLHIRWDYDSANSMNRHTFL